MLRNVDAAFLMQGWRQHVVNGVEKDGSFYGFGKERGGLLPTGDFPAYPTVSRTDVNDGDVFPALHRLQTLMELEPGVNRRIRIQNDEIRAHAKDDG